MTFSSRARRLALLSPLAAAAAVAQPAYRSALEGYQPFAEQQTAPWRQSNDTVGRIGGWKAYARDAQEAPAPARAASAAVPVPAPPPAGHGKHH